MLEVGLSSLARETIAMEKGSQPIFALTATQTSATDAGEKYYSIVLENVDLMGCRTRSRILL